VEVDVLATKPAPQVKAPTVELGYGNSFGSWWAWAAEETPELRWPQSIRVYDAMRRGDAQITSVLKAVTLPVRRTTWRVDPGSARPEVAQMVAEDLGLPLLGGAVLPPTRTRDRFAWDEHLQTALLMLPLGHMFFEQVYRVDDNGYARLRKLAPRMPRTIQRIDVALDGGLLAIAQMAPAGVKGASVVTIPVSRLVAYINERESGDWLGNSMLRSCYKNWLVKDRLLRVQAQTIERNGMGVPVYYGAENAELSDLQRGEALASSYRSGDAAGAALPFGAKLQLQGVIGNLPDANVAIRYHDEQIARSTLAHFLNLGTQTGSWALGSTFADFFTMSLQTLAQQVADTANQHIVEDLVDINFGPDEIAPRIVFDEIGSRRDATAEAIKALIESGALVPDPKLEEFFRTSFGLPSKGDVQESGPTTPPAEAPAVPAVLAVPEAP